METQTNKKVETNEEQKAVVYKNTLSIFKKQIEEEEKRQNQILSKKFAKVDTDIVITKKLPSTIETNNQGQTIITPKFEKVNLTRKINETAKVIKDNNAEDILKKFKEQLIQGV